MRGADQLATGLIDVGTVIVQMVIEGDAIMGMMSRGKLWEPRTRGRWPELVQPEKVMIDIGAYTGIYAIAAAHMGASVIALEPHRPNYERMKLNAALNSVRIVMHRVAASDSCVPTQLRTRKSVLAISDTASLEVSDPAAQVEPVHAITIDSLNVDREIGLIKIDVEGHEARVLKGMRVTLIRHMPAVVVECLTPEAVRAVVFVMQSCGYKHKDIMDNRNHLFIHSYRETGR